MRRACGANTVYLERVISEIKDHGETVDEIPCSTCRRWVRAHQPNVKAGAMDHTLYVYLIGKTK